jgi:hypothetical protein
VRHPIADEIAAAARNNLHPLLRIFLEMLFLERVELIANEDGDGHRGPPDTGCAHSVPILRRDASAVTVVSIAAAEVDDVSR